MRIEKIIHEYDATIVFFPQVIIPSEDDRKIAQKIKNNIDQSVASNIVVLQKNYSPQQLKAMMGNMDLFIGKRLHSCIFALSMFVPSLVIAYEQKAWGIMEKLCLQDYVIDVHTITPDILTKKITELLTNRKKIIKTLEKNIPIIQKEALRNGEFILDLCDKIKK